MNKILQELYHGRIWERRTNMTPEEMAILDKIQEEKQHFSGILSAGDYKRLENIEALYRKLHSLDDMVTYIHAFRLGAMIMCVVFIGEEPEK